MIRFTLLIIFVTFLHRIPKGAMLYFVLVFILASVVLAVRDIRRGYIYYFDILNLIMFPAILTMHMVFPDGTKPWLLQYGGRIVYPLLAVITIGPPLLSLPSFRLTWSGSSPYQTLLVVLWGATFVLSSTMLWLGSWLGSSEEKLIRVPLLVIVMLTIPMRVALAREFRILRERAKSGFFRLQEK